VAQEPAQPDLEQEEHVEDVADVEGGWALVEAKPHKSNDPSETLSF
jgi:hypothetical protein